MPNKTLFITEKIHAKLKSLLEGETNMTMEALGNVLLMDAACNKSKVEWAKELIKAWDIRGQAEMEKHGL